eukprot:SM000009S23488  [mRNA]  locus=s9:223872:224822:- [translate_table: standard]
MPFQQARWRGLLYKKIRLLLSPSRWPCTMTSGGGYRRWSSYPPSRSSSVLRELSIYSAAPCSIALEVILCGRTPKDSGSCTECGDCRCMIAIILATSNPKCSLGHSSVPQAIVACYRMRLSLSLQRSQALAIHQCAGRALAQASGFLGGSLAPQYSLSDMHVLTRGY